MKPSEMLRDENFECDEEMLDMVAKEVERLEAELTIRQELEELIEDGERYEMGGPFVSVHWVLNRMDALKEDEDVQPTS